MSNVIQLSAQLNRAHLLPGEVDNIYLALKIQGNKVTAAQRSALNLGMVMDRSGSMGGEKIEYTRQALAFCINNLDAADILSVVAFDDQVEVILPPGPVINKDLAKAEIAAIEARGMTNLSGGVMTAHHLVKANQVSEKVNRLIMMTDGLANRGIIEPEELVKLAANISNSGPALSCIGVGRNFDEDLLAQMAEAGRGNFYFAENPDDIPPIFAEEMQGLLQVVAQGIMLQIKPQAGAQISRVFGYEPSIGGDGSILLNLPDLYTAEEKLLLMELKVPALLEGIHTLLEINCSYLDISSQQSLEIPLKVEIHCTSDTEKTTQVNEEVDKEVELMKIADAREEAIRLADAGMFQEATEKLQFTINEAMDSKFAGDRAIISEIDELESNISYMESYTPTERKRMQYSAHQRRKNRK